MLRGPEEKFANIVKRTRLFRSYCRNKAIKAIGTQFHFVWLLCEGWGPDDLERVISTWNKYNDLKIIVSDLSRDALICHGFKEKYLTKSYSLKGNLRGSTCQRQVNFHLVSIDEDEGDAEESKNSQEDQIIEMDGKIDDEDIKAYLNHEVTFENLVKRLDGVVFQLDEEKSTRNKRKQRRIGDTEQSDWKPKNNSRGRSNSDSRSLSKRIKKNINNDDNNNNNIYICLAYFVIMYIFVL